MLNKLFIASAAIDAAAHAVQGFDPVSTSTGPSPASGNSQFRSKLDAIGNDVERLFMITEALWTLLREMHGFSDADLENVIQEVDLRSGRLDGKRARKEGPLCSSCNRRNSGRTPTCMYCGTMLPIEPFAKY